MISRRSARLIAELYVQSFRTLTGTGAYLDYQINTERFYDFLFDHGYDSWFCNSAARQKHREHLKSFLMKLHTGESLTVLTTQNWSWEKRRGMGQAYLHKLAQDILNYWSTEGRTYKPHARGRNGLLDLCASLQLDGYGFAKGVLLKPETEVLEVREETGVIQSLFSDLALEKKETAFHHLKLSEEHYMNSKWDDSISNSRKFLECVLQEVAAAHSSRINKTPLSNRIYTSPVEVRKYFEREKLLTEKEVKALAANYGLLSQTGGHPYVAQNDQARLLRHISLVLSQFVMLRLKGCQESPPDNVIR